MFMNYFKLGQLIDFRSQFILPITQLKELRQSESYRNAVQYSNRTQAIENLGYEAAIQLRSLLSNVMLQRTQNEILKSILPARTDYLILCNLTKPQLEAYDVLRSHISVAEYVDFFCVFCN